MDASIDPGPVCLITGCSSGIGHALAREVVGHGCRVALRHPFDTNVSQEDIKTYTCVMHERTHVPADEPIHLMSVCLTLDESMEVLDIAPSMTDVPFEICPQVLASMRELVGLTVGAGWRRAVKTAIGREKGCVHLREMLFAAATAAFQTIGPYRGHLQRAAGEVAPELTRTSFQRGQCFSWGYSSPVMARYAPLFFRPPVRKSD